MLAVFEFITRTLINWVLPGAHRHNNGLVASLNLPLSCLLDLLLPRSLSLSRRERSQFVWLLRNGPNGEIHTTERVVLIVSFVFALASNPHGLQLDQIGQPLPSCVLRLLCAPSL